MPSMRHDALVELFRNRPTLAAELLPFVGFTTRGAWGAAAGPTDLSDVAPTEYRADFVLFADRPHPSVVIEIQLRPDARKRRSWPAYLANLVARSRRGAVLVVVCLDDRTARWAARPIDLGHPGWALCPLVIGPEQIPAAELPNVSPELSVLTVMAHGRGPVAERLGRQAIRQIESLDQGRRKLYVDLVLASVADQVKQKLEEEVLQNYKLQSDLLRRIESDGEARGEARGELIGQRKLLRRAILRRFGAVPAKVEHRIDDADEEQLIQWSDRLFDGATLDEAFAD